MYYNSTLAQCVHLAQELQCIGYQDGCWMQDRAAYQYQMYRSSAVLSSVDHSHLLPVASRAIAQFELQRRHHLSLVQLVESDRSISPT